MLYHSRSSLLSGSWSFLSLYPMTLVAFTIGGRSCLSPDRHPRPYFTSCFSTVHTLFPGSHPSGMCLFAGEIAISLHLIYYFVGSKIYISHFTQKIQTVDRTAALLHLALLQTNLPLEQTRSSTGTVPPV